MGKTLIRCLRLRLGIKFDEDGADKGAFSCAIRRLLGINHGDQALEFGSAPVDRVDLFANQKLEAVSRTLFRLDPTSGYGAGFAINTVVGELSSCFRMAPLLLGLGQTSFVRHGNKLCLCGFELHGDLVALLDQVFNFFAVVGNPKVLDLLPKHAAELSFIKVVFGYRSEKDRPGRHAIRVEWREKVCLAQIDVIDALTHNDVEYEAEEDPGDEGVGVETILVGFCDIAEADEIQLLQASPACRIHGEEDGEGHETANEADGDGNLEIAEQEEAIESVVIENIAVRDLVESANPIKHAVGQIWRPLPVKRVCQMHAFEDGRLKPVGPYCERRERT